MNIFFENEERWDFDRHLVTFWAESDEQRVRCIVSRNAIEDSFGGTGGSKKTAFGSSVKTDHLSKSRPRH